jgi:hypothetical protein
MPDVQKSMIARAIVLIESIDTRVEGEVPDVFHTSNVENKGITQ